MTIVQYIYGSSRFLIPLADLSANGIRQALTFRLSDFPFITRSTYDADVFLVKRYIKIKACALLASGRYGYGIAFIENILIFKFQRNRGQLLGIGFQLGNETFENFDELLFLRIAGSIPCIFSDGLVGQLVFPIICVM
jgi:hypothetical protein